jgi:hypothetical protein
MWLHICGHIYQEHPPYSPKLVPSDRHLFLHLKNLLAGQILMSDQETKDIMQNWLKGLNAIFFQ